MNKKLDERGFITMVIFMIVVITVVVVLAYLHVHAKQG